MGSELKYSRPSTHTSARADVWHRRDAQFHTVHRCVTDAMESGLDERKLRFDARDPSSASWRRRSGVDAGLGGGSMMVMSTKFGEPRMEE